MSDNVRMICPNLQCQAILSVPQAARGKTIRCNSCGTTIRVPAAPPAKPQPSDAK